MTEILETFSRVFCFLKSPINENGGKSKGRAWHGFKDDGLSTVLQVAVERNLGTLVECLLACGKEVNSREGCGVTPLHFAVLSITMTTNDYK